MISERRIAGIMRRREWGLALLAVATTVVVTYVDARFLSWDNWRDIAVRCVPTLIVSCGVMLVVVTGEIDISVGSLMALLAAVLGLMASNDHWAWPLWATLPCVLLLGTGVGATTGILVAWGRVPSIIVTLGLLTALRGLTNVIMGGENIDGLPERLQVWTKHGPAGVPLGLWVAPLVVLGTAVLIYLTPLGRRIYAVGSRSEAARIVGLSQQRLKLFVFAYTGFLTALATLVEVPRLPKIEAGIGGEFELLVVTCVVVGGVSVAGGRGTLAGVSVAVLLMTMIHPVLTFLELGAEGEKWTKAIQGAFILLAVLADRMIQRSREVHSR